MQEEQLRTPSGTLAWEDLKSLLFQQNVSWLARKHLHSSHYPLKFDALQAQQLVSASTFKVLCLVGEADPFEGNREHSFMIPRKTLVRCHRMWKAIKKQRVWLLEGTNTSANYTQWDDIIIAIESQEARAEPLRVPGGLQICKRSMLLLMLTRKSLSSGSI